MRQAWNLLALAALAPAACTDQTPGLLDGEDGPGPEANPYLVYDIIDLSCANGMEVSSLRFATVDDRDVFYRDAVAELPYMLMKPRPDLPPGSVQTWEAGQSRGETVVWVTARGRPIVLGSGPDDVVVERLR